MRKKIYVLAAAVMTGIMMTACAPKGAAPETKESTVAETAAETGAGSGGESAAESTEAADADETLSRIHEAVKAAYGDNYIPNMPYDATALKEIFGIGSDLYDSFIAEGPMISVNVETFIGIKAREGKAADVASALESYRESQLDAAAQYPMNMVKFQAAQVVNHGDYVFFVMLGAADQAAEEKGEEEALESAKKNNQIAIDAIDKVINN